MKQTSVIYENDASLLQQLEKVKALWEECGRNTCICKILSVQADSAFLQHISRLLDETLPEVQYYGCTCNGIIDNGKFHQKPMLSFTIYEDPDSRAEILQFDDFEGILSALQPASLPTVTPTPGWAPWRSYPAPCNAPT